MEGPGRNDPVVASENVESQAMITFRAGYSATRQPVEIDQNSLGTYVPSSEEETATSYDMEGQSDTHDLVAPLLDDSASTDSRRSCWTRLLAFFVARHRSLIGIVLIVLYPQESVHWKIRNIQKTVISWTWTAHLRSWIVRAFSPVESDFPTTNGI